MSAPLRQTVVEVQTPTGTIQIKDQITSADRDALAALVRGADLAVEVGTFAGASAEVILDVIPGTLFTIDTFRGTPGEYTGRQDPDLVLDIARRRLARFGSRAVIMIGDSGAVARAFRPMCADLVFIDAAHDFASVCRDIAAWLPMVKPDGILIGHDFDKPLGNKPVEDLITWRDHDVGPGGLHYGVVAAVRDCFERYVTADDADSTIWHAKPQWKRE